MSGAQTSLYIEALGTVQARLGPSIVDVGPTKQRAVLACLALRAGQPVSVEEIEEAVWGPQPTSNRRALVHTYIARLRQTFEPSVPGRHRLHVIAPARSGYRLAVEAGDVDVHRFQNLVAQARLQSAAEHHRRAFDLLSEAIQLWRDPTLAELERLLHNSDEIQALRRSWARAALEFVAAGLEAEAAPAVLATAERLAGAEPLNEEIQARYLQVLERSGQRAVALEHLARIRARLREQLGVHPGQALVAVHRRLLNGDHGRGPEPAVDRPPIEVGPVRPPWRGRGPAAGDLIHREHDVDAVVQILTRNRLVTVVGPPGCGKSALALHTAAGIRESFAGGVVVVDADEVADGARLAGRVLELLGAPAGSADLAEVVGERQLLVVLDNVEHIVDAAALVVDQLIRACPHASLIVTSRERLGLPTEAVWRVHPLAVPHTEEVQALTINPAAALFVRRAAQVQPGFRLQHNNASAVATICRRLDGLPLALELAAAHLSSDTVEGVVRRLDDPLHEIRPARRGLPGHHRSLHDALKRSWDCLSTAERTFFQRLADVPREFGLDAVRGAASSSDVRRILDKLVDKSLLSLSHRSGTPTYRILGVVQHLAAQRRASAG